jgi:hypothetical protein
MRSFLQLNCMKNRGAQAVHLPADQLRPAVAAVCLAPIQAVMQAAWGMAAPFLGSCSEGSSSSQSGRAPPFQSFTAWTTVGLALVGRRECFAHQSVYSYWLLGLTPRRKS